MNKFYLSSTKNTVITLKPLRAIRLLLMVLLVCLFSNVASAQTTSPYLLQSDNLEWICPAGVNSIDVKAWGAGAGGFLPYGGGGGGAYAGNTAVAVTPGAIYIIKVGTGGGVGSAGGNSSLALKSAPSVFLVMAEGGKAGSASKLGTGGSANNSIGSPGLVWSGGSGTKGDLNNSKVGGGGGGSAGAGGDGVTGSAAGIGGTGGTGTVGTVGTSGANGGDGGTSSSRAGSPGSNPGGGGGEKFYNNGSNVSSGSGGNGQVIISWCSSTKTVASTTTWIVTNGEGSWNNGYPTNIKDLVFNNNYSSPTNLEGCSCQVNTGVNVDINSGHTLTLTKELKVLGTILFKDKSSLVQITNAQTNTGDIKYERNIDFSTISETDYTYWSSPVANFTLGSVYSHNLNGLFYSYFSNATLEDWKKESFAGIMSAGKGYIINGAKSSSAPSPPPSAPTFNGVPNNGPYSISVFSGKSNLLGNPYPSAINADTFLSANSNVLEGTIYFWTHNTKIQDANNITGVDEFGKPKAGSGAYAYTSDDYASYNITGGAATSTGNNSIPNGYISAGQGFFATAKATETVMFNNTMRVAGGTTLPNGSIVNGQFFKTKKTNGKTTNTIEKNRVWLNLTNSQGAFKQTLIGYVTDATHEFDSLFDGESFDGNEFVDFYSVNQDKNLVIQGRALPFDENDEVPLGYRTTINGDFRINIDQVDGSLTNQVVFLEDKLTNTITDLKSGNYTFNTVAGTFNDRFVLRYTNNKKTLKANNFDSLENTLLVSTKNKQIKVNSFAENIDKVTIYDIAGRQILHKANVDSTEISITNLVSNRQALIVKTVLQNGQEVSKKIVY